MNQAEGSLIRLWRSNAVVYPPCHKSHQLNNNNDTNNNNNDTNNNNNDTNNNNNDTTNNNNNNNNKNKTIKSAQSH